MDTAAEAPAWAPYIKQIVDTVWPMFMLLLTTGVAAFGAWAVYWIKEKFRVDAKSTELRSASDSLNRTINYATRSALLQKGETDPNPNARTHVSPEVVEMVLEKTKANNPNAVKSLGNSDAAIRDKIVANALDNKAAVITGLEAVAPKS